MDLIDISGSLQGLVTTFTTEITKAAPIILGAVVISVGVGIGLKWFKKLASKIG